MKRTVLFHRVWHTADGVSPEEWASDPVQCGKGVFKQSKTRTVARITAPSGERYFVKQYVNRSLFDRIFPKAKREFQSAELLRRNGIPSAEYVGWCAGHGGSIIVSRSLPEEWIPFPEFWHTHGDRAVRETLLRNIGSFLVLLIGKKLYHSDFHIGNFMVNRRDLSLKSVDPCGVRKTLFPPSPDSMTACFMDLRGGIPLEEQPEILAGTGLCGGKTDQIRSMLQRAALRMEKKLDREWPRRREQILHGSSKFAVETRPGHWERNSAWFAPMSPPPAEELESMILPVGQAEELWTDSFRKFLSGKNTERVPVIYEKNEKEGFLFFLKPGGKEFFYGFIGKKI